ncbi:MAG: Acetylpolyamine amidohydrolase [Pseudomonas citronellolis]|nr:MAG: Acetylpolyamine amidohydrolase [Pseudomonas citronellolis]
MKYSFRAGHAAHDIDEIFIRGRIIDTLEKPARALRLRDTLRSLGHTEVAPGEWDLHWLARVHDADYLAFLEHAHARWQAAGGGRLVHPHSFVPRGETRVPSGIDGQLGYYLSGGSSTLGEGTWAAALGSAHVALDAAQLLLDGERVAYALCRPPGHHAYAGQAGGFCFLNNVAVAANFLGEHLGRVALLDIDAHHGNGTQAIFYARDDLYFASVHEDPNVRYPFYSGFSDQRGSGRGEGYTLNLPLPSGADDAVWLAAIARALDAFSDFDAAVLVVSLGFDAFHGDPSAGLAVSTEGFRQAGRLIAGTRLPVLLVQEGGYLLEHLAANLTAFLEAFDGAAHD